MRSLGFALLLFTARPALCRQAGHTPGASREEADEHNDEIAAQRSGPPVVERVSGGVPAPVDVPAG